MVGQVDRLSLGGGLLLPYSYSLDIGVSVILSRHMPTRDGGKCTLEVAEAKWEVGTNYEEVK